MSTGWENHEPAPLEYFHNRLHELFHEFKLSKGKDIKVLMDGSDFHKIIAQAKTETYRKYPKQVSSKAILKTEL